MPISQPTTLLLVKTETFIKALLHQKPNTLPNIWTHLQKIQMQIQRNLYSINNFWIIRIFLGFLFKMNLGICQEDNNLWNLLIRHLFKLRNRKVDWIRRALLLCCRLVIIRVLVIRFLKRILLILLEVISKEIVIRVLLFQMILLRSIVEDLILYCRLRCHQVLKHQMNKKFPLFHTLLTQLAKVEEVAYHLSALNPATKSIWKMIIQDTQVDSNANTTPTPIPTQTANKWNFQ